MAIYKGREVQLLGRSDGADVSPMYDILDQWNQRSSVPMNQLQFTGKELDDMGKQNVDHLKYVNKIEDKDYQELKDSQDKAKIEATQKTQKPGPVEVSKVMVDPSEVQDKSTITPQMKAQSKK
jgi:hypothetical protein